MCFVKERCNWRHHVADTDLTCYKVLTKNLDNNKLYSYYFNFPYEIGQEYSQTLSESYLYCLDSLETDYIERGVFHSYTPVENNNGVSYPYIVVNEVRSFNYRKKCGSRELRNKDICIVECIIPKGSIYWVNRYGNEYCSDRIKLIRVIKL